MQRAGLKKVSVDSRAQERRPTPRQGCDGVGVDVDVDVDVGLHGDERQLFWRSEAKSESSRVADA